MILKLCVYPLLATWFFVNIKRLKIFQKLIQANKGSEEEKKTLIKLKIKFLKGVFLSLGLLTLIVFFILFLYFNMTSD